MERKEATERFNSLPIEHRVTIIANECVQEIRCLEREKREQIKSHKAIINRVNERIKNMEKWLKDL